MSHNNVAWWSVSKKCPVCGDGQLLVKERKDQSSKFVGCSQFPACKYTRNFSAPAVEAQLAAIATLEEERDALRKEVTVLRKKAAGTGTASDTETLRKKLRQLAIKLHPDRNPNGLDANEATAAILALRDELE